MTVGEMKKLLRGKPNSMEIQMPYGEGMYRSVCNADSEVVDILVTAADPDTLEIVSEEVVGQILLLMPCLCNESSEDAIEELALSSLNNHNAEQ